MNLYLKGELYRMSAEFENEETIENHQEESNESRTDTFWGCKNCGDLSFEEGYNLKLCKKCRDKLSKRPIPLQIKLVSILLMALIIFSLLRFPHVIKVGVEFERGIQAEKASKYLTAVKHYEEAIKEYPESDEILVRLYASYYQNQNIDAAYNVFDQIVGTNPSNKQMEEILVNEVNEITRKLDMYYIPSEELYNRLIDMQNPSTEELVSVLKSFVDEEEVYAAYYLASLYFDLNRFNEANEVLSKVLTKNQDFYAGYILQAAIYRELGKYDEAVEIANKAIENNVEDISAYVTLSKIELKRKNNAKGLEYAKYAYELDAQDSYIIANLALAYHYNNLLDERDRYYKLYQNSNSRDEYTDELLKSIFDGTLQWQN